MAQGGSTGKVEGTKGRDSAQPRGAQDSTKVKARLRGSCAHLHTAPPFTAIVFNSEPQTLVKHLLCASLTVQMPSSTASQWDLGCQAPGSPEGARQPRQYWGAVGREGQGTLDQAGLSTVLHPLSME